MSYFKGTLAGLTAVVFCFVVLPLVFTFCRLALFVLKHGTDGFGISVGYKVRWHAPSPIWWVLMVLVFTVGYVWQVRRLARSTRP